MIEYFEQVIDWFDSIVMCEKETEIESQAKKPWTDQILKLKR